MGFMIVLMWADRYVLIWAFTAVLTEPVGCHFQTSLLLEQKLKNYFRNLAFALVLCQCCSRNVACEAVW